MPAKPLMWIDTHPRTAWYVVSLVALRVLIELVS